MGTTVNSPSQHSVGGGGGCSSFENGVNLKCGSQPDADSNSGLRGMATAVMSAVNACSGQLLLCMQGGGGGGLTVPEPSSCQWGAGFSFSLALNARNPSTPATCPSDPQADVMATIVQQCNSKCIRAASYDVCYCPCTSVRELLLCHVVLSCPVLSCPVLSCPVLSCPVLSCPVLSCPVLSCRVTL
jgi:hypothetical protein